MYNASYYSLQGYSQVSLQIILSKLGKKYIGRQSESYIYIYATSKGIKFSIDYSITIATTIDTVAKGIKQARSPPIDVYAYIIPEGQGRKLISNSATADVDISIQGLGRKLTSGNSETSNTVSLQELGAKYTSSSSTSLVTTGVAGIGRKISLNSEQTSISTSEQGFGIKYVSRIQLSLASVLLQSLVIKILSNVINSIVSIDSQGTGKKINNFASEAFVAISTGTLVGKISRSQISANVVSSTQTSNIKLGISQPISVGSIYGSSLFNATLYNNESKTIQPIISADVLGNGYKSIQSESLIHLLTNSTGQYCRYNHGQSESQIAITTQAQSGLEAQGQSEVVAYVVPETYCSKLAVGNSSAIVQNTMESLGSSIFQDSATIDVYTVPESSGSKLAQGDSKSQVSVASQSQGYSTLNNTIQADGTIVSTQGIGSKVTIGRQHTIISLSVETLGIKSILAANTTSIITFTQAEGTRQEVIPGSEATINAIGLGVGTKITQNSSFNYTNISTEFHSIKSIIADNIIDSPSVYNTSTYGQMLYNGGDIRPYEARVYLAPQTESIAIFDIENGTKGAIVSTRGVGEKNIFVGTTTTIFLSTEGIGALVGGYSYFSYVYTKPESAGYKTTIQCTESRILVSPSSQGIPILFGAILNTIGTVVTPVSNYSKVGSDANIANLFILASGLGLNITTSKSLAYIQSIPVAMGRKIIPNSAFTMVKIITRSPIRVVFCHIKVVEPNVLLSINPPIVVWDIKESFANTSYEMLKPDLIRQDIKPILSVQIPEVALSAQDCKVILGVQKICP